MNKGVKTAAGLLAATCAGYAIARACKSTGDREWTPVKDYSGYVTLTELCKDVCNLDYPCIHDKADNIACKLMLRLCKFDDIRCDTIINNKLEAAEGCYTMFSQTANYRYMSYYNPETGYYSVTKFDKR